MWGCTSPGQFWAELGVLGCWRSGMEGSSSRGGAVVLTHTSTEGLSVIPFVLESRDRDELQFSKEKWCSIDKRPAPWGAVNCVPPHWHHGGVGSLLILGSCELRARPLASAGAALCLSWSTGWEQELQSSAGCV